MNVYRIDIKVAATACIVAESEEEARQHFNANFSKLTGDYLPVGGIVSDNSYETLVSMADDGLGNVSLSSAITYYGAYADIENPDAFELVYTPENPATDI